MKKLNRSPLPVEWVPLSCHPRGIGKLESAGGMLLAWQKNDVLEEEISGERYYLACYLPHQGWFACRWDVQHGFPNQVLPVSERAIWIYTLMGRIIHLSIADEVEATLLGISLFDFAFLHADGDNLWVRNACVLKQFHLGDQGLELVFEKDLSSRVQSMQPLSDRAWAMQESEGRLFILSSSLEETLYSEDKQTLFHCPPSFVRQEDKCYSYTQDPRLEWNKMPIEVGLSDKVVFFAQQNKVNYVAIERRHLEKAELYCFEDESANAELLLAIPISPSSHNPKGFALYNGLICVTDRKPIVVPDRKDIPENRGFLVWDPHQKTFYTDISTLLLMTHACRVVKQGVYFPVEWRAGEGRQLASGI